MGKNERESELLLFSDAVRFALSCKLHSPSLSLSLSCSIYLRQAGRHTEKERLFLSLSLVQHCAGTVRNSNTYKGKERQNERL